MISLFQFLNTYNYTVITSSPSSDCLIVIDKDSVGTLPLNKPTGLSFYNNELYIGCKYEIWKYSLYKNENILIPKQSWITGAIKIHDLAFSNELSFCNTWFNTISTLSPTNNFSNIYKPWFISSINPGDKCHLNGLASNKGSLKYYSCFGITDKKKGWKEFEQEAGIIVDINTNKPVLHNLCLPHSPRVYNDTLYFLESSLGTLNKKDGFKKEVIIKLPNFIRGLFLIDNFAFVCGSKFRHIHNKSIDSYSCIYVVDIYTGELITELKFDDVEELFDIQVLCQNNAPSLVKYNSLDIDRIFSFN